MLQITSADVVAEPFPHVLKQGILPEDLFKKLKADFPDGGVFKDQAGAHGNVGSRTGSGYDVYRGDPAFDELVRGSEAWREFSGFLNSEAFADTFRDIFKDHLDHLGLRADIRASHVDPSYVEPREVLSETATMGDRVAQAVNVVLDPFRKPGPVQLFTRLDIHRSMAGYAKKAHCDRPNRLCSLIVYFTDADETGLDGGDLLIFKHNKQKPIERYERHPHPEDVTQVAQLRPKPNLGVFFPCHNTSYHGVTQVQSQGIARDFLYINISGVQSSLWYSR
jgi:hypothetical protein